MWQSLGWNPLSPRLFLPRLGRFAAPDYPSRRAFRCESRAAGEILIYARTRPLRGSRLRVRSPGLLRQIARICHSGRIRLSPEAARSRSRSPCVRSRRLHLRSSARYFLAEYRFVVSRRSRGESAEPRSSGSLSSTRATTDPSLTSKRNSQNPLRRLCALEKNCREDVSQDARVELSGWGQSGSADRAVQTQARRRSGIPRGCIAPRMDARTQGGLAAIRGNETVRSQLTSECDQRCHARASSGP